MIKLYLNENLSWRIAKALREYGYDVISSHEAEMDQADDLTQFAFAVEQRRTVKSFRLEKSKYMSNRILERLKKNMSQSTQRLRRKKEF